MTYSWLVAAPARQFCPDRQQLPSPTHGVNPRATFAALVQQSDGGQVCYRTADLAAHTQAADVLVVATGHAGLITPDMVKEGATVIDVGMNRTEEGLRGDVDPAAAERAALMTPVPGGVGPMTIASLLRNTVEAARARAVLRSRR